MKKFKNLFLLTLIALISLNLQAKDDEKYYSINKNLTIFNSVLRELNTFYVDTINYNKLVEIGIQSMLKSLDPYTTYMPEENGDDIKMLTSGEYGGIGSIIMQKEGQVIISEPYEGMPAQRVGLIPGDVIIEVDGVSTIGKNTSEVSDLLRGQSGTDITLVVERIAKKKPITFKFVREKIQINPITYYEAKDGIGYLMLGDFTDKAAMEFRNVVNEMIEESQIHSLIIDVRSNPGGLMDEAVKIMGYFVPKGTEIVHTKARHEQLNQTYRTPNKPIYPDMKVAVLVNGSSASASEILAGSMQDLDRGIVIGERTFGKGLVQNIRPLGYDSHLKVTLAKYYTPSGRCVQALDYSHRNEDGSVGQIPDSLINTFKTLNGREVKDGGGITPDTITSKTSKMNIADYILLQNLYFDYANIYFSKNRKIATPSKFKLSNDEYLQFINYLVEEKNFSYTTQSERYFSQFEDILKLDGYDESAKEEIEALKKRITPDIESRMKEYREEIESYLSSEIIKRYYHQKGEVEYLLRSDYDTKLAREILKDQQKYNEILGVK